MQNSSQAAEDAAASTAVASAGTAALFPPMAPCSAELKSGRPKAAGKRNGGGKGSSGGRKRSDGATSDGGGKGSGSNSGGGGDSGRVREESDARCLFFESQKGCRNGDSCKWAHYQGY